MSDQYKIRILKLGGSLWEGPDFQARCRDLMRNLPRIAIQQPNEPNQPEINLIVSGGGRVADAIRAYDQSLGLSPAVAHDLALQSMSVTANLMASVTGLPIAILPASTGGHGLARWLKDVYQKVRGGNAAHHNNRTAGGAGDRALGAGDRAFGAGDRALGEQSQETPVWVCVDLAAAASLDEKIPKTWDFTSDSLALWLALKLHAQQLCLVKSCAAAAGELSFAEVRRRGWVDARFNLPPFTVEASQTRVSIIHFNQSALTECLLSGEQ